MLIHRNTNNSSPQQGFNLLELLVVLGLLAITLGVLLPSGKAMLEKSRLVSATNDVFSALLFTRNEAVRLKENASLCFISSPSATACGTQETDYLGVFVNDQLKRNYPTEDQAKLTFNGALDNQIKFFELGNREASDADVFIEVAVGNLKKQIDVCFNGRIAIRKQKNECK
ncbi:prepilin-type N-terminal cleavage/methylation domain-containing protein [Marinospirillum insulare]|uniref:Prepilin-type N-terminal cleavage/methylation domain-containing protein n=1 Tax=Marinospirillum insulare TaxID=217169 RepID=A0ABQ5ZU53_9GAMM|nr:prepilin-type N-terminal cleavage/methylation domain-containing protein [Marinospirillum insulare]GLR63700.1 hypothetical protein GCM10007878_11350 [Marinospirillum insulare]